MNDMIINIYLCIFILFIYFINFDSYVYKFTYLYRLPITTIIVKEKSFVCVLLVIYQAILNIHVLWYVAYYTILIITLSLNSIRLCIYVYLFSLIFIS